jgi:hypothetical protein
MALYGVGYSDKDVLPKSSCHARLLVELNSPGRDNRQNMQVRKEDAKKRSKNAAVTEA